MNPVDDKNKNDYEDFERHFCQNKKNDDHNKNGPLEDEKTRRKDFLFASSSSEEHKGAWGCLGATPLGEQSRQLDSTPMCDSCILCPRHDA